MNTLFRDSLKSRTLKTFHGTSVCEKKNIYSVTYFPYMCCVTGINVWGNSSVLLNCRFYGPVRGYTHTWKSTGGLFSRYWMGKAVSVNARLSETCFFFFFNSVIMKHFWSGGQETESAIYPRCQNSQPVANGISTFCYSNLRPGVISFVCFFTSLTQERKK